MTEEFWMGLVFGFIGVVGMISRLLSNYNQTSDDDHEQKSVTEDLEDDSDNDTDEFFDTETGSEIDIIERHDAEVVNGTRIIEKHDAETECDIQINEENKNENIMEQRLKSIEDTLMLLRIEMASMKRSRSKTRISIRLDQPSTNCNQMHYCQQSTPPPCWGHPMPGTQPTHSVPTPTPPPPPPMTTGTPAFRNSSQETVEACSSEEARPNQKAPVIYGRIPITTEILASVKLRPPSERIFKKRPTTTK
ncbi:uncharacterized protein LOC111031143 [Myzus persicae]|uniref:uncharacterized protein LOC111031143 n=1 Tax=Myzus persicae TaxID=13164 RepID=UPI000B9372BF|nr:uncharacterized protein LOC111031143 [Myzus persicae]